MLADYVGEDVKTVVRQTNAVSPRARLHETTVEDITTIMPWL
jgi:hypothetical protein